MLSTDLAMNVMANEEHWFAKGRTTDTHFLENLPSANNRECQMSSVVGLDGNPRNGSVASVSVAHCSLDYVTESRN